MNSVKVRFHSDSKTDTKDFSASPLKAAEDLKEDPSIEFQNYKSAYSEEGDIHKEETKSTVTIG
jgi:hypothetical protein